MNSARADWGRSGDGFTSSTMTEIGATFSRAVPLRDWQLHSGRLSAESSLHWRKHRRSGQTSSPGDGTIPDWHHFELSLSLMSFSFFCLFSFCYFEHPFAALCVLSSVVSHYLYYELQSGFYRPLAFSRSAIWRDRIGTCGNSRLSQEWQSSAEC